jgi:hypothetical protein
MNMATLEERVQALEAILFDHKVCAVIPKLSPADPLGQGFICATEGVKSPHGVVQATTLAPVLLPPAIGQWLS